MLIWQSGKSQGYLNQYFEGPQDPYTTLEVSIDSSANNIWQIGSPQKSVFDEAFSLPNVIVTDTLDFYPENNSSSFFLKPSSESFYIGFILALRWTQKLDMEANRDGGIVEISSDSGLTWSNIFDNPYVYNLYGYENENVDTLADGTMAFTGQDSQWREIWLCFETSYFFDQELLIRFTFKSDENDQNLDGWMMDNFRIEETFVHTLEKAVDQSDYLAISPNPSSGRVYINALKQEGFHIIEQIEVRDLDGRLLKSYGRSPVKFWIDLDDLPNGIYLINVKTNFKSQNFKVVLQR